MNPKITLAAVVILAALGTYVALYETKPKEPDAPKGAADEEQLLKFGSEDLRGFTVTGSDGTLSVERARGQWRITKGGKNLDNERVDTPVRGLNDLKSRRKVVESPQPSDRKTLGLEPPKASIEFDWRDASRLPKRLVLGSENLEKSGYYAQTPPSDAIYLVDRYAIDQVTGLIKSPPMATPKPTPSVLASPSPGK